MSNPLIANAAVSTRINWWVSWKATPLGLLDKVDPKLSFVFEAITTGTTGKKFELGQRFVGYKGEISGELRQITPAIIALLHPWSAAGGQISMMPPANADMYDYADELVLHPGNLDATDTTQDMIFAKACPVSPFDVKRDGSKDDVWAVSFMIFTPREQLAADLSNINPGRIGR